MKIIFFEGFLMSDLFFKKIIKLPNSGCTIIYTKNGVVTAKDALREDQYINTIPGFIEIARSIGYGITQPEIR
jgi:hypothetical protein